MLLSIFNLSAEEEDQEKSSKFISVQEFILLTDIISPPTLLSLIDNGVFPYLKTEDEL
jgi:hypothetical protein